MLFFLGKGFRVIAHDRRGHGRSTQVSDGHDMDHYAADVAAMVEHLDLRNAIHVGHSTGGGEAARLCRASRQGPRRQAGPDLGRAAVDAEDAANPGGLPIEAFDGLRSSSPPTVRSSISISRAAPSYGYNRPGAKPSQAIIQNWWRQGMMGGAKAHYDGIKAFSETDFTEDLKSITVPTLVLHGDDDQIVPIGASAPLSAKLLQNSTLKIYEKLPHGICTTHADIVNADMLTFITA